MSRPRPRRRHLPLILLLALTLFGCGHAAEQAPGRALPEPAPAPAAATGDQVAVFAGGCFWGLQALYEHVRGVHQVVAGYAGGGAATAHYEMVGTGDTGHAESVRITYDPRQVSYGELLKVFFAVAHDPSQRDRQGPDEGSQYRSEIFSTSPAQQAQASAYIAQLEAAKSFPAPIATRVEPLPRFYPAEGYHQDYARKHPDDGYIVYNDLPKLEHLQRAYPALYREPAVALANSAR